MPNPPFPDGDPDDLRPDRRPPASLPDADFKVVDEDGVASDEDLWRDVLGDDFERVERARRAPPRRS